MNSREFYTVCFVLFCFLSHNVRTMVFNPKTTIGPPSTTIVPYANSFDPVETPSNSASHLDPSCLTLRQPTLSNLKHYEN